MADTETYPVQLWVYDLTQGMARVMAPLLLGVQVEGVWHTSVVVGGHEWFFGYGVQRAIPGSTPFGQPLRKIDLGVTQVPPDLLTDLVSDLGRTKFKPEDYNLIKNNCNHFSNDLASVLTGSGIPSEYLTQHEVLLNSPLGPSLMPILQQMEGHFGSATSNGFSAAGSGAAAAAATGAASGGAAAPGGAAGASSGQGGATGNTSGNATAPPPQ